jgi:hypothetical protein
MNENRVFCRLRYEDCCEPTGRSSSSPVVTPPAGGLATITLPVASVNKGPGAGAPTDSFIGTWTGDVGVSEHAAARRPRRAPVSRLRPSFIYTSEEIGFL